MNNIFRQSIQHYSKGSNANVVIMFSVVALIAAGLTFLYVYFIARHHQDNLLFSYLMPLLLLAGGVTFIFIARSKRGDWSAIAYAFLAVFFLFGAIISFLVTLILLLWVY
jgi:EamA domain-containing membrane protein RarD